MHVNAHINTETGKKKQVWYSGTDALKRGEGVCYNTDFGTATDSEPSRGSRVERPSTSNNKAFAGVAVRDYTAQSGGQFIEIWEPGTRCVPVALAVDTVIDTGLLSFIAGASTEAGRFYSGKYLGRGSVVPRQTVTAALESDFTGGTWSLSANGLDLTVADTTGVSVGDTILLLGGEDDGTGKVVAGKYEITAIPDGTSLTLGTAAVDTTAGGALSCTGIVYTGNPVALCDLLDGEESGGVEFLSPANAGGAITDMTGGVSYVVGGATLAADSDASLAQGVLPGDKKAFVALGTLTTNDFTVPLATNGLQQDGATALASLNAFDAAGDEAYLEFNGAVWRTVGIAGGVTESAV